MFKVVILYSTAPDPETASKIADGLVAGELAACVNLFPGMISVYRWDGNIEKSGETAMIIKTTGDCAGKARDFVLENHPYDTPAVIALDTDPQNSAGQFCDWVAASCK